ITTLKSVEKTPGLYEGNLTVGYLIPAQSEVEISANYSKGTGKMTNKKSVPISLTPIDSISPITNYETNYMETKEDAFTVGNTINTLTVCFKLPDASFDDQMFGKLVLSGVKDVEFKLEELENKCYNIYPEYKVQKEDITNGLSVKFKDVKDVFGNYVKSTQIKKFDVIPLPKVFDLVLLEPVGEKINLGQTVYVKAKPIVKEGFTFSDLKELKAYVLYNEKKYNLELKDVNGEKVFVGEIASELGSEIVFKVFVSSTYKGALAEESVTKKLQTTNELNVLVLSPNESGVIDSLGKVIISLNYQNGMPYDNNTLTLNLNDKNTVFNKIIEGKYAGAFAADSSDVGFFKSGALQIKGKDAKGNTVSYTTDLPAMAWKLPLYVYYIFLGVFVLIAILTVVLKREARKRKEIVAKTVALSAEIKEGLKEKSIKEQLEEQNAKLKAAKDTREKIIHEHFTLATPDNIYSDRLARIDGEITSIEKTIAKLNYQQKNVPENQIEDKHKAMEKKLGFETETKKELNKESKIYEKAQEFMMNEMPEGKKKLQNIKEEIEKKIYTKYKEVIDKKVENILPLKDKYSSEEIKIALKEGDLPDQVIGIIIKKLYPEKESFNEEKEDKRVGM
ncbi:MAG: hypothetical protein COT14_01350, partial [Candidatus Diapherotrites archaeon CG08_land_8_20_14_0_20_30_16]